MAFGADIPRMWLGLTLPPALFARANRVIE
jgi:hypothetical protein